MPTKILILILLLIAPRAFAPEPAISGALTDHVTGSNWIVSTSWVGSFSATNFYRPTQFTIASPDYKTGKWEIDREHLHLTRPRWILHTDPATWSIASNLVFQTVWKHRTNTIVLESVPLLPPLPPVKPIDRSSP